MLRSLRLAIVPAALALSACPASVDGDIDGKKVDTLFSAFFVQDEDDIGDDTLTSVGGTGLSVLDGCNAAAKRQQNFNELLDTFLSDQEDALKDGDFDAANDANEAFVEAQVEYDEQNLPTDFWQVTLGAQALDDGDIDGAEVEIDVEDPDLEADVFAGATICRINDHPEVDEENDVKFVKTDADCFTAKKGDITVVKWEEDSTFQITADVTLAEIDDIDEEVGDVKISISAGHCKELQDALDDEEGIREDHEG